MSESSELFATVNYIKHKVEALEKIEILNLRSNRELKDEYISILQADPLLFLVYKAIDGEKAQNEIADTIKTTAKSVSVKIKKLLEYGLVEIKTIGTKGERIYKQSVAEQAFKLTKI